MKRIIYIHLILLLFNATSLIHSETIPLPEEESSPVFINASEEDDDVQLFLVGNWEINLIAGFGFGWNKKNGFNPELCYPGVSSGVSLSQNADITISLLILNKILFKAAFTDDFEDSSFMIGYRGSKDEFIKEVNAGNMGLNFTEDTIMTKYFDVSGGGHSSFGIYSLMSGPFSDHQLLFRFDPQGLLTKLYIGKDYLMEYEIEPGNYIRGQLFYIPRLPDDVEFYFECNKETADIKDDKNERFFRKAGVKDYSYSNLDGRLLLNDPAKGAVLVNSPTTNWDSVSQDSKTIDTGAGELLVIYDPGIFSEFEAASAYNLNTALPEDSYKTRVFLANSAELANSGIEITIDTIPDKGIVILKPSAGGTNIYPLYGIIENPENIYGKNSFSMEDVTAKKTILSNKRKN